MGRSVMNEIPWECQAHLVSKSGGKGVPWETLQNRVKAAKNLTDERAAICVETMQPFALDDRDPAKRFCDDALARLIQLLPE